MERAGSCWRSIYNFRPETELSNQSFKLVEYSQSELGSGGRGAHFTGLRRRQEREDGTHKTE